MFRVVELSLAWTFGGSLLSVWKLRWLVREINDRVLIFVEFLRYLLRMHNCIALLAFSYDRYSWRCSCAYSLCTRFSVAHRRKAHGRQHSCCLRRSVSWNCHSAQHGNLFVLFQLLLKGQYLLLIDMGEKFSHWQCNICILLAKTVEQKFCW